MEFDLTGKETPEQLEALLDQMGDVEVVDEGLSDEPVATTATPPVATPPATAVKPGDQAAAQPDKEGVTAAAATPAATVEQADPAKGILSKDGKHFIPYDVLEAARAEAKRNAEAGQQTAAQLAESQRQLDVLTRQLASLGAKPAELPEKTQISPEQINAIRESFPELATILDSVVQKIDYLQQRNPAPATTGNAVMDAISQIPDLKSWMEKDADRFQLATHLDSKLEKDPAWKDKPLAERFAEVTKRVKLAYGDAVEPPVAPANTTAATDKPTDAQLSAEALQKLAAEKLAAATAAAKIPGSPSDLGQANTTSADSVLEKAATASDGELMKMFAGMSEAQIEAILSKAI